MYESLEVDDASVLNADDNAAEDDISDPEEDSLAGQMAMMRGGSVKKSRPAEESDDESSTDDDRDSDSDSSSDSDWVQCMSVSRRSVLLEPYDHYSFFCLLLPFNQAIKSSCVYTIPFKVYGKTKGIN